MPAYEIRLTETRQELLEILDWRFIMENAIDMARGSIVGQIELHNFEKTTPDRQHPETLRWVIDGIIDDPIFYDGLRGCAINKRGAETRERAITRVVWTKVVIDTPELPLLTACALFYGAYGIPEGSGVFPTTSGNAGGLRRLLYAAFRMLNSRV